MYKITETRLEEERCLVGIPFTILVIIAFVASIGIQFSVESGFIGSKQASKPSYPIELIYKTKPACEGVKCWIIHYSNIYDVDTEIALRIAFAESSFNPKAENYNTNGSNDLGLFQINSIHNVPDSCRLDTHCNIKWALNKMSKVGTQPWYSSKSKWE